MAYAKYIVYNGRKDFITCETLVEALEWKSKIGGIIYEPLGLSATEKVCNDAPKITRVRKYITRMWRFVERKINYSRKKDY